MGRRQRDREQDLEREIRADLELEAAELEEQGLAPDAARAAARRAFGNVALTKEEVRAMWSWTTVEIVMQDFRHAIRNLRKSPGFTLTALLTLALGIGASTAVFTIVDSVLLKPLPYPDSGRLVAVWERVRSLGGDRAEPTGPNPRHVDYWQKRVQSFAGMAVGRQIALPVMVGSDHPRLIGTVVCTANLLDVLGIQPAMGRGMVEADDAPGAPPVALITHSLWQSLFHGDPEVLGKTLRFTNGDRRIVGVLPSGFYFPSGTELRSFRRAGQTITGGLPTEVVFPAGLNVGGFPWNGNYGNFVTLGRLRPEFSLAQAQSELNAIAPQIVAEGKIGDGKPGTLLATVQPMQEAIVGDSRSGLWFLMAAVLGLMLMACVNLANAQLGRSLARSRDGALRTALGAARWRLVWSALAENLALSIVGGAGGVLLAYTALNVFRLSAPIDLPRLVTVHVNWTVLLFAIGLTVGATVLSGTLPALRVMTADPHGALQQNSGRSMGSRHGNRMRRLLIGVQVCGCTALLLVTGLFSKSLLNLLHQDRGFDAGQVTVAEARLTPRFYQTDQSRIAFDDAVLENLRAIPGALSAGLVSAMPLDGESWIEPVQRMDQPKLETPMINLRWVSPGYFETTRQRLLAGRFFEERDRNVDSTVLSESEAKTLWGAGNPVGGQVKMQGKTFTVIGVVADSRNTSLKNAPPRMAYVLYTHRTPYTAFFVVRGPEGVGPAMREAIWKRDPGATIARVKSLDSQVADSVGTERFQTSLMLGFGVAALLLAMLGIYGVLSYSVATRKQEIGVRMALGASRGSVYRMTFGQVGAPVILGLAAGLGVSVLAGRLIRTALYGVDVVEPTVIAVVVGVFAMSAALAAFVPARRAASVDPMEALRAE
jgi:predicted permease